MQYKPCFSFPLRDYALFRAAAVQLWQLIVDYEKTNYLLLVRAF